MNPHTLAHEWTTVPGAMYFMTLSFERGFLAYCNHILSLTAGCQRED